MALVTSAASAIVVCNNASALAQLLLDGEGLNCTSSGALGTLNQYLKQANDNGPVPLYEVSHSNLIDIFCSHISIGYLRPLTVLKCV